jgi:hypothetical protein
VGFASFDRFIYMSPSKESDKCVYGYLVVGMLITLTNIYEIVVGSKSTYPMYGTLNFIETFTSPDNGKIPS